MSAFTLPPDWLSVRRGEAPLIVSLPHTGTYLPPELVPRLTSPWLARKDADWWIDQLYDFAADLGATIVHTALSRTLIDVNRDPSGASLYPGQATTELCPTTTFDGEPLYRAGDAPSEADLAIRKNLAFDPYHAALQGEIARLRAQHPKIVLYDCHSIRSVIPRLFPGELPHFNLGTNSGTSCAPGLAQGIEAICGKTAFTRISNGRFKGGYITRAYGKPEAGVHGVQMELACRGYMRDPPAPLDESNWPAPFDAVFAAPMRAALRDILSLCRDFAQSH